MNWLKKAGSLLLALVLLSSCFVIASGKTRATGEFSGIQGPTLVKRDGAWYYVKNEAVCRETTLVHWNNQRYYVKDGKVASELTTLIKHQNTWYYIYKGRVAAETTGLVKWNNQWYYVKNGKVASDVTTLVKHQGSWYYVYKGRMAAETTGLVKWNNEWYYVKNGKVASSLTTLVKHQGSWYYVYQGKVAQNTTTLVKWNDQWYYVVNGKVASDTTTLVPFSGSLYYVSQGRVAKKTTTLFKWNDQWYYVVNGKVAAGTTTLVGWAGSTYYVKDGIVDTAANGLINVNGTRYYIKDGRVQASVTTLVSHEGQYYYVENGKFCKKTLLFDFNGKTYNVVDGIANPKSNGKGKVIYLTFDDGPGPHTQRLLNVLDKYNVKATFFVCNTKYTYLFDDMVKAGHTVAIHTRSHDYAKIYASEKAFYDDLYYMQNVIYEKTGVKPYISRFPGGSSNVVSKRYCPGIMTSLTKSLTANGFRYFDWNVDSQDAGGTKTTSGVVNNVINGIKGSSRSHHYVLQHDIHSYSVDAVEQIIQWGLNNGYTFKAITMDSPACQHGVQN